MNISTPEELAAFLIELFPSFKKEWNEELESHKEFGDSIGYHEELSFNQVLSTLAPYSAQWLADLSPKQLKRFCTFLNEGVEGGGGLENAISTALLEHASQLQIRKILKPHLREAARKELR